MDKIAQKIGKASKKEINTLKTISSINIINFINDNKIKMAYLDVLPASIKNKLINILYKLYKKNHKNKFQKCLAELEIKLSYFCDIQVYYADYFNYNETISLYLPHQGFKTISIENDNNYSDYFNILKKDLYWYSMYKNRVALAMP